MLTCKLPECFNGDRLVLFELNQCKLRRIEHCPAQHECGGRSVQDMDVVIVRHLLQIRLQPLFLARDKNLEFFLGGCHAEDRSSAKKCSICRNASSRERWLRYAVLSSSDKHLEARNSRRAFAERICSCALETFPRRRNSPARARQICQLTSVTGSF